MSPELRHEALMLGVRSAFTLGVGLGLIVLSRQQRSRVLPVLAGGLLGVLLTASFIVRLRPVPFIVFMGDYDQYDESGEQLTRYFTGPDLRFDAHLTSLVMRGIIMTGLAAPEDPKGAFVVLATLATLAWAAALVTIMVAAGLSALSLRYAGLLAAAPLSVLFFGYREIAYLPLVPLAIGWFFVVRGSRAGMRRDLAIGAALVGVAAGLHGYSSIGLASLFIFVAVAAGSLRTAIARGVDAIAFGALGWVGAIPLEIIFLRLNVLPHHAGDIPWRPLFERRWDADSHRYAEAIFSAVGVRDAVVSLVLVGAPLIAVGVAALWSTRRREALAIVAATAPAVVWLVGNWTVQGIGVDTDSVIGLFPVFPLLALAAATTLRTALYGFGLLVAGHAALGLVILHHSFHSFQID